MRSIHLSLAALASVLCVIAQPGEAKACGGCFHDPSDNPSVVTDHRMILTMSQDQTTLYDQIRYQGDPKSFAWVLPIHGTVTVGLSADAVFASLDAATQTQVQQPPLNCPAPPYCPNDDRGPTAGAFASDSGSAADSGVIVTRDQVVGPYETVQLSASDPLALENWLAKNNFVVPADVQPVVDAYVKEGFDFLALKLLPGQGIQSMRPVRVTTPGASPVLPLRMVSAGTGAIVGITLWVIGDGRYEPANFPSFFISNDELVWDWSTSSSNYRTLRAAKEAATQNEGWEVESSMDLSQGQVLSGFQYGLASYDYDATSTETADQVRADDMAALFHGQQAAPRITRLRTDLAHTALTQDLSLNASSDQTQMSNVRSVSSDVNRPPCPKYPACPAASSMAGFFGGGCATAPSSSVTGDAFVFGGLGFVALAAVRRRRRKAQNRA